MASSLDFAIGIIVYLVIMALFVGILGQAGLLKDSSIIINTNPQLKNSSGINIAYTYSTTLLPGIPVCNVNGKFNTLDSELGTVQFLNGTTGTELNLSNNCYKYCSFEDITTLGSSIPFLPFATVTEMNCAGICLNSTTPTGTHTTSCTPIGGDNTSNFIDAIAGFFIFNIDFGFGEDLAFANYMIVLIFGYLPLLILVLCVFWYLRGI